MLSNYEKDKEMEVLLKEYETLRAEIGTRLDGQGQIMNVTLLLIGGMTTAGAFLFISSGQGLHPTIPLLYFVTLLLIISLLFSSLLYAFLSHQMDIGRIGLYIDHITKNRIYQLLGVEKVRLVSYRSFYWERYHAHLLTPSNWLGRLASWILALSHLVVMGLPALLTLVIATWVYATNFSLFADDMGKWIVFILLVFGSLFFLASIPCGLYVFNTFEEIRSKEH